MESEKIKEIKKALKCCSDKYGTECNNCPYLEKGCNIAVVSNALNLINELESENENISARKNAWKKQFERLLNEKQQLKDRIAELEKENARLLDSVETVQSNRCVYKCELTKKHLKEFAERLKEKGFILGAYKGVLVKDIDETLKEFLV